MEKNSDLQNILSTRTPPNIYTMYNRNIHCAILYRDKPIFLALWTLCIIVWKSDVTCYDKVICIIVYDDETSCEMILIWRILLLRVNNNVVKLWMLLYCKYFVEIFLCVLCMVQYCLVSTNLWYWLNKYQAYFYVFPIFTWF